MKNQKLREMLSKANKNQMEKSNDTAFEVLNKSEEELIKGGGEYRLIQKVVPVKGENSVALPLGN